MAELMCTSETPLNDRDPNAPETVAELIYIGLQIAPIQHIAT